MDKNDESWKARGRCVNIGPRDDIFFPDKSQASSGNKELVKFCGECAVRLRCLQYALDNDIRVGSWGGLNQYARQNLYNK